MQDDEKILSKADEEDWTLILPWLPVSRRKKKKLNYECLNLEAEQQKEKSIYWTKQKTIQTTWKPF